MHRERLNKPQLVVLITICLVSFGVAVGQNEFFSYQTPCQVTVDGELDVQASVAGPVSGLSVDSHSFAASFPIPSTTALTFSDSGDADANLSLSYTDGCSTRAFSSIDGTTDYSFDGDANTMTFSAGSRRSHSDTVRRDATGGPGSNTTASSDYTVPQLEAIRIELPFQVAGGDNGVMNVDEFSFVRTDTGPTTGNMIAAWEVFVDTDGDCQIDPVGGSIAGDVGIVFPNGTFMGQLFSFNVPRDNYILVIQYFLNSNETVTSADCTQTVSAGSDVADTLKLRFSLN